jgi:septum formation protein
MKFLRQNKPIILASNSLVRKQILQDIGIKFVVISPLFDEELAKTRLQNLSPSQLALELAMQKALSVSKIHKNKITIGSDQVCEVDKNSIDKPKNQSDARAQLSRLSGNIHYQNNAVAVALGDKIIFKKTSRVKLKMRTLSQKEIHNYIKIDNPVGSAGSYKYEALGKHLFEKISGDYYSVLGLNLQDLLFFLHKHKIIEINIS